MKEKPVYKQQLAALKEMPLVKQELDPQEFAGLLSEFRQG